MSTVTESESSGSTCIAEVGSVEDALVCAVDAKGRKVDFEAFGKLQVTEELMSHANSDAVFMHCLPAYRGLEINESIMDSHSSVVWDEAENRLHAQKALMEFLLGQI